MRYLFLMITLIGLEQIQAQSISDALLFSQPTQGGTARNLGAGGAMGALGADYGAIHHNPAGLANYIRGEIMFTPSLYSNGTKSQLIGDGNFSSSENRTRLGFDNIGLVFARHRPGTQKVINNSSRNRRAREPKVVERNWTSVNFSLGMNRTHQFGRNTYYEGQSAGSLTDRWIEEANAGIFDEFGGNLAANAGAIYQRQTNGPWVSDYLGSRGTPFFRQQTVTTQGKVDDWHLNFAAKYRNKLSLGIGVAMPVLRMERSSEYVEDDRTRQLIPDFERLSYKENVSTSANGVQIRLGTIFQPTQMVRVGLAYHSPTWYTRITDRFTSDLTYTYLENGAVKGGEENKSPDGSYQYRLTTPGRVSANLGLVFQKKGFLSADLDYVDYRQTNFEFDRSGGGSQADDKAFERQTNALIDTLYRGNVNLRFGGEVVIAEIFRVRAGYGLMGTPFANDDETFNRHSLSFGIGLREESYFIDLGIRQDKFNVQFSPYQVSKSIPRPEVKNTITNYTIQATVGFKF
jgi:hypothetical protein